MKLIFITLFASVCLLRAETTNTPVAPEGGAEITASKARFELKTRETTYWGNVWILVPPMELTCTHLTARLQTNSTHPESIVASSNVVVLMREPGGATYTNWSEKAVYTFKPDGSQTNETLVLTGSPVVIKWEAKTSTADSITWDIGHDSIQADNLRGVFPDVKSLKKPVKREPTEVAPTNSAPANATAPAPDPKPSNP